MSLAWIASYPKSGNSWVRILLTSYLQDEQVELTKDRFRRYAVLDLLDMIRRGTMPPLDDPRPLAFKTHFLPGVDVLKPYRDGTGKVLYIVRNLRDVIPPARSGTCASARNTGRRSPGISSTIVGSRPGGSSVSGPGPSTCGNGRRRSGCTGISRTPTSTFCGTRT